MPWKNKLVNDNIHVLFASTVGGTKVTPDYNLKVDKIETQYAGLQFKR